MRWTGLLPLAFLAAAGCLGGDDSNGPGGGQAAIEPLSAKAHDVRAPEEVWVASSQDGKRIHNALYRPDTDGPVPVFINFSPYWGDTAMVEGDAFSQHLIHEYVPRGYAVVLSSVRGTGHSEGCFQIGGDLELRDAHDVVEHFATQPWSNGNVGAGGKSYDSTTQNGLIAKFPHPALKGIFHVSGITDMYRYNYRDGVPYANGVEFTPRYYVTQGLDEYAGATNGAGSPGDEDAESMMRLLDDAACPELPEHIASGEGSAATGLKDAYWQERDWTATIGGSSWTGSIFFVHGLQDWNVKPDHILPWLDNLPAGVRVLGWLHQWQEGGTGHVYPMRTDWNETMLRWMDATLKGKRTGMESLWGYEVEGTDGVWRRSADWPPAPASEAVLPDDVACNSTCSIVEVEAVAPAGAALRLSGAPTLTFAWRAQSPDPVLSAVLWDEDAAGGRTWVSEAVLRGTLRDGLASPQPVVPGSAYASTLVFYPVDHVLEAGHRLVVAFGEEPTHAIAPQATVDGLVVDTPGDAFYQAAGAVFAASIAPAGAGVTDPQPQPMGCFTC